LNGLPFQEYWFFESAAVRKSIATIVVIIASATLVLGVTTPKRPAYCPLPENITFDRTQHPEIIGLYTGSWTPTTDIGILYVRKSCILVTSINGNEVRGIYSWEKGGWDGQSGWREIDTASSSPFSTIEFSTVQSGDWRGINELKLTLEFHKKRKATATYTWTGRGVLGRRVQTELQSRLVEIE
jgi:hypothetical protein